MVGAGMSVAAGIPDFRTPGTGLYDNLEKYNLPYPEAVFDLSFFCQNPLPFYALCKELWPDQYRPTLAHYFIALLHRKGRLQRCYTQNIDSLETLAGLPVDKLVAAHGNFDGATCLATGRKVKPAEVREAVMAGEAACLELNQRHGGLVKPDIVFFGENLPARFFHLVPEDFGACDLLVILGTSLQVHPFAGLVCETRPGVPRILLNRELVGQSLGLNFAMPEGLDVFLRGDCDEAVREVAAALGLEAELLELRRAAEEAVAEDSHAAA